MYDGYHFGGNSEGIYNPLSILSYLEDVKNFEGDNYWIDSVPMNERGAFLNHIVRAKNKNKIILNLHKSFDVKELYNRREGIENNVSQTPSTDG